MVELQPSKLVTWVRFPSPAPIPLQPIESSGLLHHARREWSILQHSPTTSARPFNLVHAPGLMPARYPLLSNPVPTTEQASSMLRKGCSAPRSHRTMSSMRAPSQSSPQGRQTHARGQGMAFLDQVPSVQPGSPWGQRQAQRRLPKSPSQKHNHPRQALSAWALIVKRAALISGDFGLCPIPAIPSAQLAPALWGIQSMRAGQQNRSCGAWALVWSGCGASGEGW